MKSLKINFLFALLICCTCINLKAQVRNSQIGAQSFVGEIIIEADKSTVWNVLTNVREFCDIMEYKYLDGARSFEKVGDYTHIEEWGERGVFMLTTYMLNKELRYTLEPENGSYICSERWTLTTTGNNTTVKLELRYTESGKQSSESINEQVQHYNTVLMKLKRKAEY